MTAAVHLISDIACDDAPRHPGLLAALPDHAFDRLLALVARTFRVTAAALLIFEQNRVWCKSSAGAEPLQVSREGAWAGCELPAAPVVVSDALANPPPPPLASMMPGGRFYAAVPLDTFMGHHVGVLCIMDGQPRQFSADDLALLIVMAAVATEQMEQHVLLHQLTVSEEQLAHATLHDGLTGLPNRTLFLDRLGRAVMRARRHDDYRFAVLLLDLDRFKNINDSLGHKVGDQLLVAIARRLETCLRAEDTVARFSGDEFTILLDSLADLNDARFVAERIHRLLTRPFDIAGHEIFTNASIGIVLSSALYSQPEELLRDADLAMHRAKALGKARHEIFEQAMRDRALAQLQTEIDLRRAIQREEFRVYYQPIVSLSSGDVIGFEALVRWAHPQRGILPPGEFLAIAEETGLSPIIGEWVLREACRQLCAWHRQFPHRANLSMSVNLSGSQFSQPELTAQVDQILQETGLDPHNLRLEITEDTVIENGEVAAATLARLRTMGVRLSIDDFGVGYSSLSQLHRFPTSTLKIDRSFVALIDSGRDDAIILKAIVALAHNLGMEVVAEGVETAAHVDHFRSLECEYAQGFFFARPLDSGTAAMLLSAPAQW